MARKRYMADTETTTEVPTKVWAYAICEIGHEDDLTYGDTIDGLMDFFKSNPAIYYFHNLAFDGEFIVYWLLSHGWKYDENGGERTFKALISDANKWYSIDICWEIRGRRKIKTTIYDSWKKLPFSVKALAEAFKTKEKKLTLDYHEAWKDPEWQKDKAVVDYISDDVKIVSESLDFTLSEGLDKMTIGSDAFNDFKNMFGKSRFEHTFPKLSYELDTALRNAYKGGFTWANPKFKGKTIDGGMVYDVNSLYPATMANKPLPYGQPLPFKGKYEEDKGYPLYVQHLRCFFELKEGYIPTIQIKHSYFRDSDYLTSSDGELVDLYLPNPDLELFFEHYNVISPEYIDGWKFASQKGMFNNYINKWMAVKQQYKDGPKRQQAKLMLNNLYGKFATNPDVTGKKPYIGKDGAVHLEVKDKELRDPVYIPIGIFCTSWARHTTITTAQAVYDRILYCDTDSIHIAGTEIPKVIDHLIDPKRLGFWKHESTFGRGKFLRAKTYIEDIDCSQNRVKAGDYVSYPLGTDQTLKVKAVDYKFSGNIMLEDGTILPANEVYHYHIRCAGMQDAIRRKITWKDFEIGFQAHGNLRPKHVPGGIVLVDRPFKIRA